jgi:hypothetical protein
MNRELALKVANSVLYEGYMLYPYRPSAVKNRQRWTFGILYPPAYGEVISGTERSGMHSECLIKTEGNAELEIELRFLQLADQRGEQSSNTEHADDCVERSIQIRWNLGQESQKLEPFLFRVDDGCEIKGAISLCSEQVEAGITKLILDATNTSSLSADGDREAALFPSLLSAHLILAVKNGEFVSLLDPSQELRCAVTNCRNVGNFPVLVGDADERDMMLCSPILLYDYPQIAPESAGDFYDATEMDEMLTLRVMTLTDDEKNEMRLADDRVRQLLERTEQSAREQLMRTHGTIRSMRPVRD